MRLSARVHDAFLVTCLSLSLSIFSPTSLPVFVIVSLCPLSIPLSTPSGKVCRWPTGRVIKSLSLSSLFSLSHSNLVTYIPSQDWRLDSSRPELSLLSIHSFVLLGNCVASTWVPGPVRESVRVRVVLCYVMCVYVCNVGKRCQCWGELSVAAAPAVAYSCPTLDLSQKNGQQWVIQVLIRRGSRSLQSFLPLFFPSRNALSLFSYFSFFFFFFNILFRFLCQCRSYAVEKCQSSNLCSCIRSVVRDVIVSLFDYWRSTLQTGSWEKSGSLPSHPLWSCSVWGKEWQGKRRWRRMFLPFSLPGMDGCFTSPFDRIFLLDSFSLFSPSPSPKRL